MENGPAATYDVVVVGAGPSGASCAYWLADAGWRVALVEKKEFPRDKTCGDGLTPRAVHQLARRWGSRPRSPRAATGTTACAATASAPAWRWPGPSTRSSRTTATPSPATTSTAWSPNAARDAGADLLTGREAVAAIDVAGAPGALAGAAGVVTRDHDGATAEVRGRYVVVADGQNSRIGRELGATRNRAWPMGMALRSYYTSPRSAEPWIDSHLDIRDPAGQVVPGYGWLFPLGDGRVNVGVGLLSTEGAGKGVNTTKLQDYFVAQVAEAWGLSAEPLAAPTGGRLLMGLSIGPRVGANTLLVGDAAGAINPFNGEGIAYGYETGRLAAAALGDALAGAGPGALARYDERLAAAYGDYYRVARAFVRVISDPRALSVCVASGMRVEPVMSAMLKVMANLMSGRRGVVERGYLGALRLLEAADRAR